MQCKIVFPLVMNNYDKILKSKDPAYIAGAVFGLLAAAAIIASVQSVVLGFVLGWFGVKFTFWQCLVIVMLISSITGSNSSK